MTKEICYAKIISYIRQIVLPFKRALFGRGLDPTPIVCDLCKVLLLTASLSSVDGVSSLISSFLSSITSSFFFLSLAGLCGTEPVLKKRD